MSYRCLACHTEVSTQMQVPTSLHGRLRAIDSNLQCQVCHVEHGGPDGKLTALASARFPHQATGYSLQGHQKSAQGAAFTCKDCHTQWVSPFDAGICGDCHRQMDAAFMQAHDQAFGPGCLACHDGLDSYGKQFDHNKQAFPLTGKHATAPCAGCHLGATSPSDLKATPQECYACHQKDDPHQGHFGQNCAGCHTPDDWKKATFDHSKSAFPLTGAHLQVPCAQCHVNNVFKGTKSDCYSCHPEPDLHKGLLGTDCAACHTPSAWSPAKLDRPHPFPFDHGAGGPSPCRTCHPDTLQTYTCYGCHEHDPGQIAAKHREEGITDLKDCAKCHPTGQKVG